MLIHAPFLLFSNGVVAQSTFDDFFKPSDTLHTKRRNAVVISEAVLTSAALVGLHQIWYTDYEKSSFQFKNDNNDWLQMDKAGHVFSAYHLGSFGANALKWSGAEKKSKLLYGSTLGLTFLTVVEVFDGFSQEWGASRL